MVKKHGHLSSYPLRLISINLTPKSCRFNCDCKDGFEGDLCETNTDDCVDHQCSNGGVCVDDIAGYNCQCPEK